VNDKKTKSFATETIPPSASESPETIGNYRIIQKLGEGGMGEVYEAEQTEPIRRRIALKIIKWGMDTKQVVARFESERQALALMNHPNIAKVFDAGATEQGRPFFVMECVKGVPITEYCDKHKLNNRQRLELFNQVCDGIQYAHQKGIIHRDIKASNVLVMIQDDKPVPKIIDFGVAKATAQRLTEKSVFTEMGQLIGTPEYMSPEQAEMSGLDIDTRTDVYSLGVLLYELLVGVLPFESEDLRSAGFDEIRRKIREVEPPKPSTRLTTPGFDTAHALKNRQMDLSTLAKQLKGELDWITMKAMAKDRTQRYASASELAADVTRYLKQEPVVAGPPSATYRLRKYVRRPSRFFKDRWPSKKKLWDRMILRSATRSPTSAFCIISRPSTSRRNLSSGAHWRSGKKHWVQSIRMWGLPCTIWPISTGVRGNMIKPRRIMSVRKRSSRRHWARNIRMLPTALGSMRIFTEIKGSMGRQRICISVLLNCSKRAWDPII